MPITFLIFLGNKILTSSFALKNVQALIFIKLLCFYEFFTVFATSALATIA